MEQPRNTIEILDVAEKHLESLGGHVFDVLTITKPISPSAGVNLSKVISKLSPLLGNLIEFNLVELLNDREEFQGLGKWERQDPGFPDRYLALPVEKQSEILKTVGSNYSFDGATITVTYRKPFDVLAKGLSSDIWHPRRDSNPCCRRERAVS